jgi:hypothetical protein
VTWLGWNFSPCWKRMLCCYNSVQTRCYFLSGLSVVMINYSRPGCPRVMSWPLSFFDPLPESCCFGSDVCVFLCVFLVCWEEYCQACYSSGYRFLSVPHHQLSNMPVYVSCCLHDFHQWRGTPLRWVQQDCNVSNFYSSCFRYPNIVRPQKR